MGEWVCSKCNVKMENVNDIKLIYNDIDLPQAVGYRCPSCKVEFLDGEFTVNELNSAEQMLEGK